MTDYPFNMQLAVTSLDENTVVRDGSVSVYDPEDTDGTTLLTLTTPGGVPLANPLTTNEYGFVQPFVATLPQVMWRSGDYEGYFESYKGLRDEAAGARDAAAESALMAIAAANGLQIGTVETGVDPAATITGTAPDRLLNFVLPQGPVGPEGPPATAGPLDGLTDVTAPSPTNGQALIWDAATSLWKNTTIPTPASTLDALTDVTAPSPVNGQALIWDSATSQWKNTTLATGVTTLDGLTDVTAPTPSNGQALTWDSATSQWKNTTLSAGHNIGDDLIQTATYNPTVTGPTSGSQPLLNVQIAPGSRTGPILRVGTTTSGTFSGNPQGIRIDKQGTGALISAGNTSSPSITHFEVDSNGFITRMNNRDNFYFGPMDAGSTPEGTVTGKYGLYIGQGGGWSAGDRPGRLYHKAWHHSYSDGWVAVGANTDFQTKTANYTMAVMDELIIGNGSSITITLPDPAQIIMGGRLYRIKNIHSTALTVVSAGTSKTIDGAASTVLAQWDKITVVSDGTQWLIVDGRKPFTVSTTAPTAPVNGDVWFDIS